MIVLPSMSFSNKENSPFLFSIVIPIYNRPDCARKSISSVLDQINIQSQLIVVDDGSDKATKEVIDDTLNGYIKDNPSMKHNILLITKKNGGSSSARNAGINAALGKYITFIDGDDRLASGFLLHGTSLVINPDYQDVDLFIFEIETLDAANNAVIGGGSTLKHNCFESSAEFADAIIKNHKYMWYSQSNKFYKLDIIKDNKIGFAQGITFGEDRYFNYDYLLNINGRVVTDPKTMLYYYQYDFPTQSSKMHLDYFERILSLHSKKIECLFSLSKHTSEQEKYDYINYDLTNEIEQAVLRFDKYPDEEESTIKQINKLVFLDEPVTTNNLDYLVVLGSYKCDYRVKKALKIYKSFDVDKIIVCGGVKSYYGDMTEAEFMADYLQQNDVPSSAIIVENRSETTVQNVSEFFEIINANSVDNVKSSCDNVDDNEKNSEEICLTNVGIISGGFHLHRVKKIIDQRIESFGTNSNNQAMSNLAFHYIPAYGPHTKPDNWYKEKKWLKLVLKEFNAW